MSSLNAHAGANTCFKVGSKVKGEASSMTHLITPPLLLRRRCEAGQLGTSLIVHKRLVHVIWMGARGTCGKSVSVNGGEVRSGKEYRVWMTKETKAEFEPILPADPRSECEECRAGRQHTQTKITKTGGKVQNRLSREGFTKEAVANRLPPKLAEHLSRAMKAARTKLLNGKNA